MFQLHARNADLGFRTRSLCIVLCSYIPLASAHFIVTKQFDLPCFFGERSEAAFDLWSFQHLLAGILISAIIFRMRRFRSWSERMTMVLLVEFIWEVAELFMEAGCFGQRIAAWKGGFEHWSNRLVGDPLAVFLGVLLAKRFPSSWKIALFPAAIWLGTNITYKSSMFIQHFLLGDRSHAAQSHSSERN
jgi:hypothetical protein